MALDAHVKGRHHLVALYAGTALEHLAKACLARRSPVLLAEFKNEDSSFRSVLLLLEIRTKAGQHATSAPSALHLRTVSLRGAFERMRSFVTSAAGWEDLMSLAGMRDGTVHAAADAEVATRIVVAFVKHVDALVADLRRDRGRFWGTRRPVADALSARARDTVTHAVQVKLASARANFQRYREPLVVQALQQAAASQPVGQDQAHAECPACGSVGTVTGFHSADSAWSDGPGGAREMGLDAEFTAESFACPICGLRLRSSAEVEAAGMPLSWAAGCDNDHEL